MTRTYVRAVQGFAAASLIAVSLTGAKAAQTGAAAIRIDADDIGGTVTSSRGPEAGVWVIA